MYAFQRRDLCIAQISLLLGTTAIRGAVDQCTSLYTGQRRVFLAKNSLLFNTTAVRGGTEKPFRKPFEIDDADARSVQKTPAGVLVVRRGLFFVKRQRRYAAYLQKRR